MEASEEEKAARRKKRQSKHILHTLQSRIKDGSATVEMMAWLLTHEMARLNHKLTAIDDAYASGLLPQYEVLGQQNKPNLSDFDLVSETHRTWFDRLQDKIVPNGRMNTNFTVAFFLISWLIGYMVLRATGADPKEAAFKGAISFIFTGIAGSIMFGGAREFWKSYDPLLKREQAYRDAMLRYEVIQEIRRLTVKAKSANAMYDATGPEFEALVARAFRKWGYSVTECGGANDGGVDLIATRGQEYALVQCKAHAKAIGPAVLRDLYGALSHSKANYAYLASLHGVSSNAANWVRDKPISVLTTDDLVLNVMPDRITAKYNSVTKHQE